MQTQDIHTMLALVAGKWPDILTAAGIPDRFLTGKHGPCPFCGGKDRFRFTNHQNRGGYICNQCAPNGGDGVAFLMAWRGCRFKDAVTWLRDYLRLPSSVAPVERESATGFIPAGNPEPISESELTRRYQSMCNVWRKSRALTGGCLGSIYLQSRGVWHGTAPVPSLRVIANLGYYTGKDKQGDFPALLAAVTALDGRNISIHRTYLNHDGTSKAPVPEPKKLMQSLGTISGAAVRLFPAGDVLGVAEGIETALAASMLHGGLPVWACLSTNGVKSFMVPDTVKELVIFADHDNEGIKAAKTLQSRYHDTIKTKILTPEQAGSDWADVAKGGAK